MCLHWECEAPAERIFSGQIGSAGASHSRNLSPGQEHAIALCRAQLDRLNFLTDARGYLILRWLTAL